MKNFDAENNPLALALVLSLTALALVSLFAFALIVEMQEDEDEEEQVQLQPSEESFCNAMASFAKQVMADRQNQVDLEGVLSRFVEGSSQTIDAMQKEIIHESYRYSLYPTLEGKLLVIETFEKSWMEECVKRVDRGL